MSNFQTELIRHLADLNEEEVLALVHRRLEAGHDPLAIVEECQRGMRIVGERYENREYFLSGLIMSGEIFRQVMEIVQPIIADNTVEADHGRILIGTVQGDIHDIGKNMFSMLAGCHGFLVQDLGVDVPPETFFEQGQQFQPDIIGLSGLLTLSYDYMRETVQLLRSPQAGELRRATILIGGSLLDDQVRQYIGADYYCRDAMSGVRLCQKLTN